MKTLNVESLTKVVSDFAAERDWNQFHSIKNLSTALAVEAAELAEIFQWLSEEQSNRGHLDPKTRQKMEDEIADVTIYLLRILEKTGIDWESAVLQKMKRNGEKYPVHLAKGNATKYDSL